MNQNQNDLTTTESRAEHVDQRPAIAPRVDVYEGKDDVLLFADVPGATKEGIDIRFRDGELTLEAQREAMPGHTKAFVYRRTFLVPQTIDATKIDAELSQGVLRVKLPKAEEVKPRRIEVRAG